MVYAARPVTDMEPLRHRGNAEITEKHGDLSFLSAQSFSDCFASLINRCLLSKLRLGVGRVSDKFGLWNLA
jgi:hypothetical protein